MLYIVASFHCMQFQGKLMNQAWENGKKTSFGTDFVPFGPNLGPKIFFHGFYFYYMLDIVASYHCMQFQGKLINQTWENGKKNKFWDWFWPKFGPKNIFSWVLLLLYGRHCCKLSLYAISRETDEPNLRKWQKTKFRDWFWSLWPKCGPQKFLSWNLPLLHVRSCCKLSLHAISRKTNEPNLRKW